LYVKADLEHWNIIFEKLFYFKLCVNVKYFFKFNQLLAEAPETNWNWGHKFRREAHEDFLLCPHFSAVPPVWRSAGIHTKMCSHTVCA